MSVDCLISEHKGPLFYMVVRIDKCEFCMMHVLMQVISGDVDELELQSLAVRRDLTLHAGTVPCVAIMCQEQPPFVQVEHRDRIVGTSGRGHLMHERISSGSGLQRNVRGL